MAVFAGNLRYARSTSYGGAPDGAYIYTQKIYYELQNIMRLTNCRSLANITADKLIDPAQQEALSKGGRNMSKNYRSELVGTFCNPIDKNPTGVVMEAGFAEKGLDWRYITMKVEPGDLKSAMEGMKTMQMRGLNLTIPLRLRA